MSLFLRIIILVIFGWPFFCRADNAQAKDMATVTVCSVSANKAGHCDYNCDGKNDDIEINAAIKSLPKRGGTVYFSEGQFTIGEPIIIPTGGIKLQGAGSDATVIYLGDKADVNMIELRTDHKDEWFTMQDIWIDGNRKNQTKTDLKGVVDVSGEHHVRDVHIQNVFVTFISGNGIEFNDGWGAILDGVTVEFCLAHGVQINGGNDIKIVNSKIITNLGNAVYLGKEAAYVKIANNLLQAGTGHDVIYIAGDNNIVTGNTILDSKEDNQEGIVVEGENNLVANNFIHLTKGMINGIRLTEYAHNNYLTDNIIKAEVGNPIVDSGYANVIISYLPEKGLTFNGFSSGAKKGQKLCLGSDNTLCVCGKCP